MAIEINADGSFKTLKELERDYIIALLENKRNNKSEVARTLGVSIKTIYNKLHEHGLDQQYNFGRWCNRDIKELACMRCGARTESGCICLSPAENE